MADVRPDTLDIRRHDEVSTRISYCTCMRDPGSLLRAEGCLTNAQLGGANRVCSLGGCHKDWGPGDTALPALPSLPCEGVGPSEERTGSAIAYGDPSTLDAQLR